MFVFSAGFEKAGIKIIIPAEKATNLMNFRLNESPEGLFSV